MINILIKVKYSSIVNLIMDEEIVPELLQKNMNPSSIATQLDILLNMKSKERELILSKYAVLKENLGKPGVYGSCLLYTSPSPRDCDNYWSASLNIVYIIFSPFYTLFVQSINDL